MKKEICVIALSFVFDLFFFYFLFGMLRWNFLFSAVLAVLLYMALTLLLKPVRKIGKVKVETLRDGEHLREKLEEARADLKSIERSMTKIRDLELKEESERLHRTAGNILKYLEENPGKIPQARQFIDYYQDTASQLLEKYVDLQNTGLNTEDTRRLKVQTEEAIRTLNEAFENQFQKLMSEELLDMEAELQLLRQTMKMEGHSTTRQANGGEKGGAREI
nr:5-bromo-4-chloroindolyl phosphate hydrolysis family protein [Massilistercora timonensis]